MKYVEIAETSWLGMGLTIAGASIFAGAAHLGSEACMAFCATSGTVGPLAGLTFTSTAALAMFGAVTAVRGFQMLERGCRTLLWSTRQG